MCPLPGTRTIHAMAKVSEPTRSDRVGDKQRTLRYLAFFEAMADLEDEGPLWHSLSAGLVTLRLVDEWLARGGRNAAELYRELTAASPAPASGPSRPSDSRSSACP